jgi:hypothetical protein
VALGAQWIAETQRERKTLELQLGEHIPGGELTAKEVRALVDALRDIVSVLVAADPADKSELYAQLGVALSYDPTGNVTVKTEPRGVTVRVGGGTSAPAPRPPRPADRAVACRLTANGLPLQRVRGGTGPLAPTPLLLAGRLPTA